jgi:UDP-glucuronate 4-epimerase
VICFDNFNGFLYSPKLKKDNVSQIKNHPNFVLIKGDILNKDLLDKIFQKENIRKIIHLAALAGVRPSLSFPDRYLETNVKGTINLLEKAKEKKIKQFIFCSSSSVYGESAKIPFKEEEKILIPVSPYGASKLSGEIFCRTYYYLYRIPTTILRFFTVYGPRQRPEMAIHKFVRLITQKKTVQVFDNGKSSRDYTYIGDIIEGIIKALDNINDFEVFNLGNSHPIKLEKIVDVIGKKLGIKARIKKMPSQPGDVSRTFADIKKAKEKLGWVPKFSIEKGIGNFIEWYKEKEAFLNKVK